MFEVAAAKPVIRTKPFEAEDFMSVSPNPWHRYDQDVGKFLVGEKWSECRARGLGRLELNQGLIPYEWADSCRRSFGVVPVICISA